MVDIRNACPWTRDAEGHKMALHEGGKASFVEGLFAENGLDGRYSQDLLELIQQCLRFEPSQRPSPDELFSEIVARFPVEEMNHPEMCPEMEFGPQRYKVGSQVPRAVFSSTTSSPGLPNDWEDNLP